jgi:pilus assembly protein CpaE
MSFTLMIASPDDQLRELVRDAVAATPSARILTEFVDVSANLYIRVLQELDRFPEAALLLDISSDPVNGLKALEKLRLAVPELYILATDYSEDGESILMTIRAGATDYLTLPLKRSDLRDALLRLDRAPRRAASGGSQLGKIYTFLGAKGGVGTTSLAVNFATIQAQRKKQTVLLDLDWPANDVAMMLGSTPQYTLAEVGDNLDRMDQTLFEGFVSRDPAGFFYVGPPDSLDANRGAFTDSMLRECPAVRNAQRYLGYLMRLGFTQDQIRIVINKYQKKPAAQYATLDQVKQTLSQPVFYGIPDSPAVLASINKARPLVTDRQAFAEMDKTLRAFADKATGVKREQAA